MFNVFNDSSLSKFEKRILFCVFYSVPICLFAFYSISILYNPDTIQVIRKKDLSLNFSGVVDSVYRQKRNHNIPTALLKGNYKFEYPSLWESKIEVGDSLSKSKETYLLKIFKRNGKVIHLDYRSTYK